MKRNMERKWYLVRVCFPATHGLSAFIHEDEIRGTSPENALENAWKNWVDAEKIELAE
jgi:hypothetical protein